MPFTVSLKGQRVQKQPKIGAPAFAITVLEEALGAVVKKCSVFKFGMWMPWVKKSFEKGEGKKFWVKISSVRIQTHYLPGVSSLL